MKYFYMPKITNLCYRVKGAYTFLELEKPIIFLYILNG